MNLGCSKIPVTKPSVVIVELRVMSEALELALRMSLRTSETRKFARQYCMLYSWLLYLSCPKSYITNVFYQITLENFLTKLFDCLIARYAVERVSISS